MNDLNSRQAAIDAILHNQEVYSNNFGDAPIDKYTVAIIDNDAQTIAQLPTIDPVKHGEWIVEEGVCEPVYMECSCCEWIIEYYGGLEEEWNYCPHCGARME